MTIHQTWDIDTEYRDKHQTTYNALANVLLGEKAPSNLRPNHGEVVLAGRKITKAVLWRMVEGYEFEDPATDVDIKAKVKEWMK